MKILNIFELGNLGGPQKRAITLAMELKNYGVETIFLIPKDSYFPKTNFKTVRINLHRITRDKKHLLSYAILFPYEVYKIHDVIKRENPDIIYCNGAWQFKGIIAGRLARKKIVWHLNDTLMPWVVRANFKIMSKFSNGFIVTGEKAKDYWITYIPKDKKVLTINAPIDLESEYNPYSVEEDSFIAKFGGIKVVNVSNINPVKGLEYFIRMAANLNKEYSNLVFFIVGKVFPSQRKYFEGLKKLAKQLNLKNLYFYTDAPKINAVLKAADIFVFTSLSEASPLAVWEAMAMELPIVSTDVGDVAKFIKDGVNGFVVSPKDLQSLVDRVSFLLKNPHVWKQFGVKNRQIAITNFNVKLIATNIKNFLYSL